MASLDKWLAEVRVLEAIPGDPPDLLHLNRIAWLVEILT